MSKQKEILGNLFDAAEDEAASESLFDQLMNVDLRYLRGDAVGSGAMKEIFSTKDRKTGRLVAMAILKNSEDKRAVESFLREARINARLQHPHIVPVYDIGVNEEGCPYFTMKLVPGLSLKEIIDGLKAGEPEVADKYSLPVLIDIFLRVCEAVAYAHSEGICHLDLKPDNIRVSSFGEVRVCDWGLANFIGDDSRLEEEDSFLHYKSRYRTLDGQIKGTPGYMAPEQAVGKREPKDQRTDVFALGCILYILLTRCEAIEGESLEEILENTCSESITPPTQRSPGEYIPESLEAVCMKSLKLDPGERYSSVEEIITEIEAYRNGFATKAEDPSLFKQLSLFYMRNSSFCILAFLFITVLITVTVFFIENIRNTEKVALETLAKLEIQQDKTVKALAKIQEQQQFKEKIGQESAALFAHKATSEFKKQRLEGAREFAETSLLLDSKNIKANSTIAKIKMIEGKFNEGLIIMENNPDPAEHEDLSKFCKAAIELKSKEDLTLESMYSLLKQHIKPNRTPFYNQILQRYLAPFEQTEKLEKQLSWLIKTHNSMKDLELTLKYKNGSFDADLSGNQELKEIFFLRMIPVTELNITETSVTNSKLLLEMKLKALYISKGSMKGTAYQRLRQTLKLKEK